MKQDDIFYCSDIYGSRFIKLISIDNDWALFYKSPILFDIVLNSNVKNIENRNSELYKQQNKVWYVEKLINNHTFNGRFRGCIKVPIEIINSIIKNEIINIDDIPYMEYSNNKIICKDVSKEEYRRLKINSILI